MYFFLHNYNVISKILRISIKVIKKESCIINLINEILQFIVIFEKYA